MLADPRHWQGYYPAGDRLSLLYGWSDRIRYYWDRPEVSKAVDDLFASLAGKRLPAQLLSQFVPHLSPPDFMGGPARIGDARAIPGLVVDTVLAGYERACFPSAAGRKTEEL
jgi:D-tagatose-1,6-bisphosphate aldolase subunit GatZ/KbaZ